MLMTFDADGTVQFTRNPKALALVEGIGTLRITRMSEILFDEVAQRFYIRFTTGEFAQLILRWTDAGLVRAANLACLFSNFWQQHSPGLVEKHTLPSPEQGTVYFATYEDAVTIEVAFIDFLREQGVRVE